MLLVITNQRSKCDVRVISNDVEDLKVVYNYADGSLTKIISQLIAQND